MLTVSIKQTPLASYALMVNNVAIIRSVVIKNDGDTDYHNLRLKIVFDPEFADTIVENIDSLPAHEHHKRLDIKPSINTSFVCNLTEKITVKTTVQVLSSSDEVLAETKGEMELLDYCQYWGNNFMSQYVAAFVTPRHIALDPIIKRASELLKRWTGDGSLSAYQYDVPNRPKMIVGAIYEAIAEQNITYCCSTRTLVKLGQKIRTCEELLSPTRGKRGCCLDMALLMCSCLEAVGLNPILIMQDTHAFAGCWLVDDMFADSVNDDPSVVTKRTSEGINEIILVETVCANEGGDTSFDEAVISATEKIHNIEKFEFVLDVARARISGVQPLPQRIFNGNEYEVINDEPVAQRHSTPEDVGQTFTFAKDKSEENRFDQWERRLLDLTTRNGLLNVRFYKNTLRLMVSSLSDVVQLLESDHEISILDRPHDWDGGVNSRDLGERISATDPILKSLHKDAQGDKLRSYQDGKKLPKTLTELYRSSRLAIEESGANTLYVALGFLKWFDPTKAKPFFAPIVLYPIRLERRSANKGYYMTSRDEDLLLNETLFEFLKQNYNIELPDISAAIHNEKGVDIRYILAAVRKAVMEQDHWDVVEEATVSIFEFNRFVIWNDIRTNREQMSEHPLISSLVSGVLDGSMAEEVSTDVELPSDQVALPIPADSSQLAAICEAASGRSFVLHGPPGTGKSQTITNIISNALFQGKRVLFVAEKMAALEVVQRRLAAIGLDPFCLELHSNKTKKSMVMDQLRKTTEVVQQMGDEAFQREAAHLDELKRELNGHVERLHKKHSAGLSVYDCFERYSTIDMPESSCVKLSDKYIDTLTSELLREHTELVENYESTAGVVAEYSNSLREIGMLSYSPDVRNRCQELITQTLHEATDLKSVAESVAELLRLNISELTKAQYDAIHTVAWFVLGDPMPLGLIPNLNVELLNGLKELATLRKELEARMAELTARYNEHILDVNSVELRQKWLAAEHKWVLAKYLDRRAVIGTLSSYALDGKRIADGDVLTLCDVLDNIHRIQGEVDEVLDHIDRRYSVKRELRGIDALTLSTFHERLGKLLSQTSQLQYADYSLTCQIANLLAGGWSSFKEHNGRVLQNYIASYSSLKADIAQLEELTTSKLEYDGEWVIKIEQTLLRWSNNIVNLRSKVAYNVVRKQLFDVGLGAVVEAFEVGMVLSGEITKVYLKSLYKYSANRFISQDKELSFFQSILFEDKIKRFRKLCKEFETITRRELVIRLTSMLPALRKEASQSSDVGFLQRCIRNGCRGVSIRKLFETIPDLISRMCPVMLMSPLSVSQYLGSNWPQFDMVVFDEASQMPTCEAVAAISRGRSAVVVGDEHQLPPTNFFEAGVVSERYSESVDLESILEDCLALSMPQKYLLWHYRSKHESLITFSNRHFYLNSLKTFPSNDDMATKVSFEYVNGVYSRGSGCDNKEEAKAVVAEIKQRLSNPETASQSIGVVTFNVNQQSLIEDMLGDMLRSNPELEMLANQMHEPIFIKNLENVQGDERDVILFSVGYGRDKQGKVTMTFGPLNRDGGERRLNVAVSRARYQMKIFSSLRYDDIDLYRSDSKGVKYLKSFLEYAERGKIALRDVEYGQKGRSKDAFVEAVASTLRERGYEVNTNIGSSEYRVDIGVVDPKNPNRYMLGLLCDGHNYLSSQTAHDRDVTIPSVLRMLGWQLHNIWSVEWWDTPQHVLNGIIREIERAQTDSAKTDEQAVEPEQPAVEQSSADTQQSAVPGASARRYMTTILPKRNVYAAMFTQGQYEDSVKMDIRTILDVEAPISRRLLTKRLLNSYGISRSGIRINAYLDQIFRSMNLVSSGSDDLFFWRDREQRDSFSGYRISSREALDVAPEEVAQAVIQVLREQFAIGEQGLVTETARLLGYANVRDNALASMRRGIAYAMDKGVILLDDGRYRLAN